MSRDISRACLNMSDYFFKDCTEYLWRYELCMNDDRFSGIKSWDAKLFIDLRMAYEAILKAIFIYYSCRKKEYDEIDKKVKKYNHSLDKLINEISCLDQVSSRIQKYITYVSKEIHEIPVGLRYSFDTYEFVAAREELYYQTLRSDRWQSKIHTNIKLLRSALQQEYDNLPIEYKITNGSELINERLFRRRKYTKRIKN